MRKLAKQLGEDADLWEVVGICHDFDEEVTRADRSKHGLLTAEWLADDLPVAALDAIKAHDHRTGFVSDTPLAGKESFKIATADRPFLFAIIRERAEQLNMSFQQLSDTMCELSVQKPAGRLRT